MEVTSVDQNMRHEQGTDTATPKWENNRPLRDIGSTRSKAIIVGTNMGSHFLKTK